ncbi:basic helix-loop-helix ARNT-like protein 1 isoform X2 [Aedes albopictus]|uniref:Methoprene-tolerant protein n=1 Tax=Aedes albopictus TaxID=7160 RepID=A0ABM1ZRR0_AEDAL|nr:aryl hydrocarbon receptor nuclear translocator-like protein 1 isoform X2 [Aedes albopictus]
MKEESNPKPLPPTGNSASSSLVSAVGGLVRGAAVAIGSQIAVFPASASATGLPPLQRPPRTISCTSYDSESDDCMQRGGPSSVATEPSAVRMDSTDADKFYASASGNNSASKYDCEDSKAACKILNGREARNRAEKNRRDKLNGSIQELSGMVPHVAESPRRVDKTAVLRFSAHALRVKYVFQDQEQEQEQQQQQLQQQASNRSNVVVQKSEVQDTLFRMLNGFLLTVTCRGQIVLVSASVEQFLGHCQTDLYGQNLFNLIHPDDQNLLKQQLVPSNLVNLFDSASVPTPSTSRTSTSAGMTTETSAEEQQRRSQDEEDEIDRKLRQDRRKFTLRIARAGPRSEPTAYELVTIDGFFRRADAAPRGERPSGPSGLQLLRRARGRDDGISLHSINGNDIVLVAMARVQKVPTICDRLIEACRYEYKTRHLIDGRIVQCDHRISVVAGYLTTEVSGLSPFTFMHKDDVRWVIVALRQMYDYSQNYGESCYRLMTRTGDFVYLKTRGYLEVDDSSKKVQSFVCINTLVSDEEGRRLVREMKHKFSVIVEAEDLPDESDEPAVENPTQIEKAVLNLLTNLHSEDDEPSDRALPSTASQETDAPEGSQLAIIAPSSKTVKSAIVKSMNVIAIASKKMSNGSNSPLRDSAGTSPKPKEHSGGSSSGIITRPSVLQKAHSPALESRVPPLHGTDHDFIQPFSPAGSTSSSSSGGSVFSPASHQRNSRSPFGGSIPPTSPPAIAATPSTSVSRIVDNTASGHSRSISVLKRTHSNSSCLDSSSDGSTIGHTADFVVQKRPKVNTILDLDTCRTRLSNPATDLITMLPQAFHAVDQSLMKVDDDTAKLRAQVSGYENLQSKSLQQLDSIVEASHEQRNVLQSIKHELTQFQSNNGNDGEGGGAGAGVASARGPLGVNDILPGGGVGAIIVDDLDQPSLLMEDFPSDSSNLMADLDNNGSLLGGDSPLEFFSSINTPMISPTTATASVITSSRSVGAGGGAGAPGATGTAGSFYQGADLNPS